MIERKALVGKLETMKNLRLLLLLFLPSLLHAQEWEDVTPRLSGFERCFTSRSQLYAQHNNTLCLLQYDQQQYTMKEVDFPASHSVIYMDDTLLVSAHPSSKQTAYLPQRRFEPIDSIDFYHIENDTVFKWVKSLRIDKISSLVHQRLYLWFKGIIVSPLESGYGIDWYNPSTGTKTAIPTSYGPNTPFIVGDELLVQAYDTLRVFTANGQLRIKVPFALNQKIAAVEVHGQQIYLGTDKGVLLTDFNYQDYTTMNEGLEDTSVVALHVWKDTLYAGTLAGNYVYLQGKWKPLLSGIAYSSPILIHYQDHFFAGGKEGVNVRRSGNQNWENVYQYSSMLEFDYMTHHNGLIIGISTNVIATSRDLGRTWQRNMTAFPGAHSNYFRTCLMTDSVIYLGDDVGNIYTSTDGAKTWQKRSTISSPNNSYSFSVNQLMVTDNKLFASCYSGLFYSADLLHWQESVYGPVYSTVRSANGNYFCNSGYYTNGIMKTPVIDAGWNWKTIAESKGPDLWVNGNTLYVSIPEQGIYVSTDEGVSWAHSYKGIEPDDTTGWTRICDVNKNHILAFSGNSGNFYIYKENGNTWTKLAQIQSLYGTGSSFVIDNYILTSQQTRVYRKELKDVTTSTHVELEEAQRAVVYPNPFSQRLWIDSKAMRGYILYDQLGEPGLSGNQNQQDTSLLQNGSYVLRIELENGSSVTKHLVKAN